MLRLVGLALLSFSLSAAGNAATAPRGKLVVVGNGLASSEPEFAKVQVIVTSICYDTARGAKNANAVLANRVVTLLKGFATTSDDAVTATGGPLLRQTETILVEGEPKTICQEKWRASNLVTLQLRTLSILPDIQDAVIQAIETQGEVDPARVSQTYAELGRPIFGVKATTEARLRREAQLEAYDDAKAQLDAFASRCAFQDVHITSIAQPTYRVARPAASDSLESSPEAETPIIPDRFQVSAEWRFEWSYVAPSTCPR